MHAEFNTQIENSNNNLHVIAMVGLDKHKLLSSFTGKIHFIPSIVK